MTHAFWSMKPDGFYWLDVVMGQMPMELVIDTGFVDPNQRVGVALAAPVFDSLHASGALSQPKTRISTDASGQKASVMTAAIHAQLLHPTTRRPIGPHVSTRALRGAATVNSRLGLAFFHRLAGCRVLGNLDQCQWCIEYP